MNSEHDQLEARLRAADQQFASSGPATESLVQGVRRLEQRRIRQRWQRRTALGVVAALAGIAGWLSLPRPAPEIVQQPAVPAVPPTPEAEPLPNEALAAIRQTQTEIAEQLARARLQQLTWRYQDLSRQLLALNEQRQVARQRADLRPALQVDPSIDFGF